MTAADAPRTEGVLLCRKLLVELTLLARQCVQVRAGAEVLRARESAAWVTLELAGPALEDGLRAALEDLQAAPNSHDLRHWAIAQQRLADQVVDRGRRLLAVLEAAEVPT